MDDVSFTASEVAIIADLNVETLRVWRRRNYFKLQGEEAGSWTRYTLDDVRQIATFRTLTRDENMDPRTAMFVASAVRGGDHFAAMDRPGVEPRYVLFCRGKLDVEVGLRAAMDKAAEYLIDDETSRPVVHIVSLGAIEASVLSRLAEMREAAERKRTK